LRGVRLPLPAQLNFQHDFIGQNASEND